MRRAILSFAVCAMWLFNAGGQTQTSSSSSPPANSSQNPNTTSSTSSSAETQADNKQYIRWRKERYKKKNPSAEDLDRIYLQFGTNGIEISDPKYYDDALLSQQLEMDRSRLAALNAFDQSSIKAGAVSGASQTTNNVSASVQGPSLPGLQTTLAAGATSPSTTQTIAAANPPQVSVPGATALAGNYNVSGSGILNEQLQLQEEIADLSLLLEGAVSDQFIQGAAGVFPRVRATIGVPIMINTPKQFRNAIAVVEVSVQSSCEARRTATPQSSTASSPDACIQPYTKDGSSDYERPTVLSVLPREKTFNVAALTDKNVNVAGGMVTNVIGVSGGFLHSHKTYYLVKDQDTIAGTYVTGSTNAVGMWWLFRPVLGQDIVAPGPRQLVAQVGFPYPADPSRRTTAPLGTIYVASYWRKFNRHTGAIGPEILGSYVNYTLHASIPDLSLGRSLMRINRAELLHDGTFFMNVTGTFTPGSYVRIGSKIYRDASTGLQLQNHSFGLSVPLNEMAASRAFLVYRDGNEEEISAATCSQAPTGKITGHYADDTHVEISVKMTKAPVIAADSPTPIRYVLSTGNKAYPSLVTPKDQDTLTFTVAASDLDPQSRITLRPLLTSNGTDGARCELNASLDDLGLPPMSQKAVFLGIDGANARYMLQNEKLSCTKLLFPSGATLTDSAGNSACSNPVPANAPGSAPGLFLVSVSKDKIGSDGGTLLLQDGNGFPFSISLPATAAAKSATVPKAKEPVAVGSDEAVILDGAIGSNTQVLFGKSVLPDTLQGSDLTVTGLTAAKVTAEPGAKTLTLKSDTKSVSVDLEVVSGKVATSGK